MTQSITLQNLADTAIVNNDILGQLCFAAPNEADGTDSILISASIFARSEGTFAADNNATELVFVTGASESADPGATNYDMTLSSAGNLTVAGTIECATSLTIGSAAMVEADLEFLDGITAGTAAASKAVVLDGSKNIATIGTVGCGAITSTGTSSFATSVKTPLIEYTDGDDSMTIADGGKVTFAAGFAVGSDASGDILYHNGTSYVRLAKGSDDEVLTLASGLPSWATGGGSGDITAVVAGTGLTGGATSGSATVNVIGGDGITANANDVAITAAQTTITSVYNASLKMGRDSQNLIDFATTDNKIILRVNNVDEVELVANVLSPVTSDGVALGTGSLMWSDLFLASGSVINFNNGDVTLTHSANTLTVAGGNLAATFVGDITGDVTGTADTATVATTVTITDNEDTNEENAVVFTAGGDVDGGNLGLESDGHLTYNPSSGTVTATIFKGNIDAVDGDFDGTLEADAITLGGTALGSLYSVIAGSSSIVTVGTIGTGVWQGTAIAGGYIANDAIDSQHYADGSIDNAHIADDAIDSEHYAAGSIDTAHIADNQVTLGKMAGITRGSIIIGDASGDPAALGIGSNNYVLTSDGTDIAWAAAGGGSGDITGVTLAGDSGSAADTSANVDLTIAGGNGITTSGSSTTLTVALDAALTTVTSLLATDIKIGEDDQTKIDFETADEIHFYAANVEQVYLADNIFGPQSDSDVDLGTTGVRWKDAYIDTITTTGDVDVLGNIELGHASDTTIARASAGQITVEGTAVILAGAVTGITSLLATDIKIGEDAQTAIDFETANEIHFDADNAERVKIASDGLYVDKIRRHSDSSTTTKILLNDEVLKLYAGHSSNNICTIDSTGLTIDNGSLETATIDYTDGDLAITIADGGSTTFAQQLTASKAIKGAIVTATEDATVVIDLSTSNYFEITLGANVTDIDFTNGSVGQRFVIRFEQPAGANYTIVYSAVTHDLDGGGSPAAVTVSWPGGTAPTMTATNDKADTYGFIVRAEGHFDGYVIGQNIAETTN